MHRPQRARKAADWLSARERVALDCLVLPCALINSSRLATVTRKACSFPGDDLDQEWTRSVGQQDARNSIKQSNQAIQSINQPAQARSRQGTPRTGQGNQIRSSTPRPLSSRVASDIEVQCDVLRCDALSRQPSPACAVLFFARPRLSSSAAGSAGWSPALASAALLAGADPWGPDLD